MRPHGALHMIQCSISKPGRDIRHGERLRSSPEISEHAANLPRMDDRLSTCLRVSPALHWDLAPLACRRSLVVAWVVTSFAASQRSPSFSISTLLQSFYQSSPLQETASLWPSLLSGCHCKELSGKEAIGRWWRSDSGLNFSGPGRPCKDRKLRFMLPCLQMTLSRSWRARSRT
ncbi:hypothetical protein OBBRIDRAFT_117466 [Obba rivulosa]|uniref:Uncharacterized protein n=1 Tax=Obba rivulosa TaxID=1052685 RepID=A0A8E2DJK2_9APHY|nr:hypothetical protein OBBRIDRAFT_117466 [Obba rivulosa]